MVKDDGKLLKLVRMTPKKLKSLKIIIALAPISFILVMLFISLGFLSPYFYLLLILIAVGGAVPFAITTIRLLVHKKIPINFYPVISVLILAGIIAFNLFVIVMIPIDVLMTHQGRRMPEITTGEFPFRVVYELDGDIHVLEDVLICEFDGITNSGRNWRWRLRYDVDATMINGFRDTLLILEGEYMYSIFTPDRLNQRFNIFVDAGTCGYYMGDRQGWISEPRIQIQERLISEGGGLSIHDRDLTFEQLEVYFGIRMIEFIFSEPIRNQFN